MDILVLLKQTFDTEEKIAIEGGRIKEDGVKFIINPYDEYAVEEAVRLKEQFGGEVTAVTVGPARSESAIRTALAMGADRALLVEYEGEADESVIARMIVAAVKDRKFDLIFGGSMAIDSGAGQVAIRVAEILGIPHVSGITKLTIQGESAVVERDAEGDMEVIEIPLPFLATAQQGLNEPRYPSLPGIMKAKKKPIEILSANQLGLTDEEMRPKTVNCGLSLPSRKKDAAKILSGEIPDQVKELVHMLRHEAKVV